MKKIWCIILSGIFILGTAAQKVIHDANVEVRTVSSFSAIKVSGGIDLYLSYGDEAVAVSAKETGYRAHIKTEVEGGVLKIWYEWKDGRNILISTNKGLKAYVSYKSLKALSASGGSDILVDGTVQATDLDLNISGGSDFKGAVNVSGLKVQASGGSDVDISGKAAAVNITVSGGSDLSGFGLQTENAKIQASGGSDVELQVAKEITASASGGSDVRYKGGASVTNVQSSGASSVKKVSR